MKTMLSLVVGAFAFSVGATDVEINVPEGTTSTITEALTALGKTSADIADNRIVKTGGGTLVGEAAVANFVGTTIREGVFSAHVDSALGKGTAGTDAIYISDGATLRLTGTTDSYNIVNRMVHLAGAGAPDQGGCIVGKRALPNYGQWILDADAVIASDNADGSSDAGYTKMLELQATQTPYIKFYGHTLTLRAVNGSKGFLWAWGMWFRVGGYPESGDGKLVVDGCTLAERSKTAAQFSAIRDARSNVTLVLTNGASFLPSSQSPVSLFAGIDAANGTTIGAYWDPSVQPFDITIGNFAGTPTFDAKITSLAITNDFTVRVADLKAGNRLTLAGPITFGSEVVLRVEGDLLGLGLTDGERVAVAVSDTSVSGVPALDPYVSSSHWTVEAGTDGKSLELVYHYTKPEGSIDIAAEWGLRTGAANASANSTAFAAHLAALAEQPAKLFLPPGEYWFDAPLAIGARPGLSLLGDAGDSKIRVTDGDTVISVDGAQNLTITRLTLSGSTGPAVVAENAAGLSVANNFYTQVAGTVADSDGKYPVVARNCTNTFVLDNYVLDGGLYAAPVLHVGGTSAAAGEPVTVNRQRLCRVWVPAGKTEDFFTALAKTGYAVYPVSNRLVKVGGGTLIGTNTLANSASSTSSIWGVTVEEGTFSVRVNDDMGFQDAAVRDPIYVKPGATLLLDSANTARVINNRVVHLAGSGAPDRHGAVEAASMAQVTYAQYYLDADAVMATTYEADHALCLGSVSSANSSNLDLQGHNLTLRSANAANKGFRLDNKFRFKSGGTLTVDGTYFGQPSAAIVPTLDSKAYGKVTLRLVNGATFRPRTQGIVSLFENIEADEISQVLAGEAGSAAFDMTIGGWAGTGAVGDGVASLTITNAFRAKADDILAGRRLNARCPITFANTAKMTLEDAEDLTAEGAPYLCAVSMASVSGVPRKAPGSPFRGWRAALGEDGMSLVLDRFGFLLMLR